MRKTVVSSLLCWFQNDLCAKYRTCLKIFIKLPTIGRAESINQCKRKTRENRFNGNKTDSLEEARFRSPFLFTLLVEEHDLICCPFCMHKRLGEGTDMLRKHLGSLRTREQNCVPEFGLSRVSLRLGPAAQEGVSSPTQPSRWVISGPPAVEWGTLGVTAGR